MLIRTYVLYHHLNRLMLQNSRFHSHPRKLHRSYTTIVQYIVYRGFLQPLTHKTLESAAKHHKVQPIDAGGRGQCMSNFRIIFTDTCVCVCVLHIFRQRGPNVGIWRPSQRHVAPSTERLSIHAYVLHMRKRNCKHCHVAGAHIEQSLIGKKEMDPKLMMEINEKRMYVICTST